MCQEVSFSPSFEMPGNTYRVRVRVTTFCTELSLWKKTERRESKYCTTLIPMDSNIGGI